MALPAGALFASAADVDVVAHSISLELPPAPPCAAPRLLRRAWRWPWRLLQLALLPSPLLAAAAVWAWRRLVPLLRRSRDDADGTAQRRRQLALVSALLDAFEGSGCNECLLAANALQLEVPLGGEAGPEASPDWQAAVAGGPLELDLKSGALAALLQQLPRRERVVALAACAAVPQPANAAGAPAVALPSSIAGLMLCRRGGVERRQSSTWALREREQRHPCWSAAERWVVAGKRLVQLALYVAAAWLDANPLLLAVLQLLCL